MPVRLSPMRDAILSVFPDGLPAGMSTTKAAKKVKEQTGVSVTSEYVKLVFRRLKKGRIPDKQVAPPVPVEQVAPPVPVEQVAPPVPVEQVTSKDTERMSPRARIKNSPKKKPSVKEPGKTSRCFEEIWAIKELSNKVGGLDVLQQMITELKQLGVT